MVSGPANGAPIRVVTESFPGRPIFDTAVTHALLRQVAEGDCPETIRLYVPDDIVLFSLLDARRPGFVRARQAGQACGSAAVLRLAGGHAALFHPQCLAFSWAMPDSGERDAIQKRFQSISEWLRSGLSQVGVDARIGEVPGEYCPGEYSVNAEGRLKLMGVGQRVVRGAAHIGGVIVVGDSQRVKNVLRPVYQALDLSWDPETAGAVEDVVPGVHPTDVRSALLDHLGNQRDWTTGRIDPATRRRAESLLDWHDPSRSPRANATAQPGSKIVTLQDSTTEA
ncbi:MAG: lipoate--protein ligase family protein [Myxococcota bacterium]|nr:lipoate--protein ligase family protein [Myxococcota bacterium]